MCHEMGTPILGMGPSPQCPCTQAPGGAPAWAKTGVILPLAGPWGKGGLGKRGSAALGSLPATSSRGRKRVLFLNGPAKACTKEAVREGVGSAPSLGSSRGSEALVCAWQVLAPLGSTACPLHNCCPANLPPGAPRLPQDHCCPRANETQASSVVDPRDGACACMSQSRTALRLC